MKKIFKLLHAFVAYILLFGVLSCTNNEVEPLFEKTINERTDVLKKEYLDILTAPENGWIGYYSPNKNFGAYAMLMKFDKDGNLAIKSDYKEGTKDNTITYRLDKTLKIELVFETFSVFHDIFEINNNDNQGEFVFNILSATNDEIVLESKLDGGDDITIFKLKRASASDLDLEPVYASINNVAGDGTQSVFRNILLNNEAIATFKFNPITRLTTVSYIEKGKMIAVNVPIAVTATGFNFIKPLVINGTTLTSFTFDSVNNQFVNEVDKLKIIYDNIPGIPLNTYAFGIEANSIRYNYLEPGKSSLAFDSFINNFYEDIYTDYEMTIDRIYIRNLQTAPYIHIYTNYGNIEFDVNYEIKADGKVYFTLTGSSNAPAIFTEIMTPLLDVIVNSNSGYYTNLTGGLQGGSQTTFSMINADEPKYEINYYTF